MQTLPWNELKRRWKWALLVTTTSRKKGKKIPRCSRGWRKEIPGTSGLTSCGSSSVMTLLQGSSSGKHKSRSICIVKIKQLLGKKWCFYYLNGASFPGLFSLFQLKQIPFRIATNNFHLISLVSFWTELGFAFHPGQDGWKRDAGEGPLPGLHLGQLHQGLLMLLHDLGEPWIWRHSSRLAVWGRMEFPLEKTPKFVIKLEYIRPLV